MTNGQNNNPGLIIGYGELNEIYDKLMDVEIKDPYIQLDYEHHQMVRVIEALRLCMIDRMLDPSFKVELNEK